MNQTRQLDSRPAENALPNEPEIRASIQCSTRRLCTGVLGGLFLGSLLSLTACPGNLEDPQRFETAPTATATATAPPTGGAGAGGTPTVVVDPCVTTLFTASCAFAGCHAAGAGAAGDLDLTASGLAARLVGVDAKFTGVGDPTSCMPAKYIDTATGANSWLLTKVKGTQGSCGLQMPVGGMLTADQLTCVTNFVNSAAGAK